MFPRRTFLSLTLAITGLLALATQAPAGNISLEFDTDPNLIYPGGQLPILEMRLGGRSFMGSWGGGSGFNKASRLANLFQEKQLADPTFFPGVTATVTHVKDKNGNDDPRKGRLTLSGDNLPKFTRGIFYPGRSGEGRDRSFTNGRDPWGAIGFQNSAFNEIGSDGNASLFYGGIATDLGELSFTLSANELPDLQGSTIVQALYNDLSPTIANYGVQIVGYTPGDDVLNFYFDPNQTNFSEVIFGTTAESDGVFGSMTVADLPEPATLLMLGSGAVVGLASWLVRRVRRARN